MIPDSDVQVYFLCIEIFIRIMALSPIEISNQTLESHIQKSFLSALNYYRQTNIKLKRIKDILETGYDVSRYLNGDIAPNIYYYASKYEEDLYLIKEIIFKNYNLVCLYNYMNIESVFEYFRQNYKYTSENREKIKTFKDLMDIEPPIKDTKRMIENDRNIFSYKNLETKTKFSKELVTSLILIREAETRFSKQIKQHFEDIDKKEIEIKDIFKFYIDFFVLNDLSVSNFLLTKKVNNQTFSERFCKYSILEQDIYDELKIIGDLKNKHIIFKYKDHYSLLVIDDEEKIITHYFSTYKEILYEYFKKNTNQYNYRVNYEMKSSSCKINEICIIFLIYYNQQNLSNNYNMIYIQDETLKSILEVCSSILGQKT